MANETIEPSRHTVDHRCKGSTAQKRRAFRTDRDSDRSRPYAGVDHEFDRADIERRLKQAQGIRAKAARRARRRHGGIEQAHTLADRGNFSPAHTVGREGVAKEHSVPTDEIGRTL